MQQVFILKEVLGTIKEPSELFKKIKEINIDFSQENLIVFYLNCKNEVIDSQVVFKGGLNSCICEPNQIFKKALLNNASNIIIAHNHPSNSLNPSEQDIKIFKVLEKGGEILNIKVLDSIIFNRKEFYSIRDEVA